MSNAITITEVEHEGVTFDLATQELGNGDTAYWLMLDGELIVAETADEMTAAEVAAEVMEWVQLPQPEYIDPYRARRNELADYYYDNRF